MKVKTVLKIGGMACSAIGFVATMVGNAISDKQVKMEIAEQVAEQLANTLGHIRKGA